MINPPRSPFNAIYDHAPGEAQKYIHRKLIGPPLGLMTIATCLRDCDIDFLEMKGEYDLNPDAPSAEKMTEEAVNRLHPDIVGISVITSEFNASIGILQKVRSLNPEILTVAGGLHATLCPQDFNLDCIDLIVSGHGVSSFQKIIDSYKNGRPPGKSLFGMFRHIGGIFIRTVDALQPTGIPEESFDIGGRNFIYPKRLWVEKWKDTYKAGGSPFPSTYIFTSLSCPYRCSFCSIWPQYRENYTQRNVESVIDELKSVPEYPIVRFSDANTLVDPVFANLLCSRIEEEGIKKTYIMDIRTDFAVKYPEIISRFARAGLKVVISGFESFREEELKKYNKSQDAVLIKKAVQIFHSHGIMVRGNYVIPPDYTEKDFEELAAFSHANRVSFAGYTILSPMPGTAFYSQVKQDIIDTDYRKYNFFNCVTKTILPLEKFYEMTATLWLIKKGTDVI
ncbi:MAG: hypothetical protein A2096_17765 [Spirochaetes bacterium GWF1_41_5]|nr:MAG: hypothetical protein A2096_17765 [Spirochaetes bacterium GWF1_41_5]